MGNKSIVWIIVLISLFNIAFAFNVNKFSNGETTEDLSFSTNETLRRSLILPFGINTFNSFITINNMVNKYTFNDSFNRANSDIIGNDWNSYETINNNVTINESSLLMNIVSNTCGVSRNYINMTDELRFNVTFDFSFLLFTSPLNVGLFSNATLINESALQGTTAFGVTYENSPTNQIKLYYNGTLLNNQTTNFGVNGLNFTTNIIYNGTTIMVKVWDNESTSPPIWNVSANISLSSLNKTGDVLFIQTANSGRNKIHYFNISYTNTTHNQTLTVGDNRVWLNSTFKFNTNKIDLQGEIETILNNTCNCSSCYNDGSSCYIPFSFNSTLGTDSNLRYSLINHTYNYTFLLTDCTEKGIPTLNISVKNESNESFVTVNFEATFNYSQSNDVDGTVSKLYSFNETMNNKTICIFSNSTTVQSDFQFLYTSLGTSYSYFNQDVNLSNSTKLLTLYVTDATTDVLFNVKDTDGNDVQGALISIQKFDVGSGTYKTTETLETDNSGNAVGQIVLFDFYRIRITYNNELELEDAPTQFVSTTRNYVIDLKDPDWFDQYDNYKGIVYELIYNNITTNFKLTFDDPNLEIFRGCLRVTKLNISGNNIIGDSCVTSQSGTILINRGTSYNNSKFIYTGYVIYPSGDEYVLETKEVDFTHDWEFWDGNEEKSRAGVFASFLLILTLVMLGLWSPTSSIVMALIGVAISVIFGWWAVSFSMILTLFILGGIAIWRINRA